MKTHSNKSDQSQLMNRWLTSKGIAFRQKIIDMLKINKHIEWDKLEIEIDKKKYLWFDFEGVKEFKQDRSSREDFWCDYFFNEIDNNNYLNGDLRFINLTNEIIPECNLSFIDFSNAIFFDRNNISSDYYKEHIAVWDYYFIYPVAAKQGMDLNYIHADFSKSDVKYSLFDGADLRDVKFCESNFKGASFIKANLENASFNSSNMTDADLSFSRMNGTDLAFVCFDNADITSSIFHLPSFWWNLSPSTFLLRQIYKRRKQPFLSKICINLVKILEGLDRESISLRNTCIKGAQFKNSKYQSDPLLYKNIIDQQFLDEYGHKHYLYNYIWFITSFFGKSYLLLAFWSFIFGTIFGFIYMDISSPSWFPEDLKVLLDTIDPHFHFSTIENDIQWWQPFYLSFVTMTTLGFASAEPLNTAAFIWHTLQNFIGYILLGYLVAVLGNKLTRRGID